MPSLSRLLRCLICLSALCLLSACIQVEVRFDIRPDGSGQVTETYRVKQGSSLLPGGANPLAAYLNPLRLSERALDMAPGTSVSAEALPQDGPDHVAQVTYDVADFNGLVWRFGQRPMPESLRYRFELKRVPGQPTRVNVFNDPYVGSLSRASVKDATTMGRLVDTVEGMAGVQLKVEVAGQGEVLKTTGRWQAGSVTTLFDVRADELMARPGWQERLRQPASSGGVAACEARDEPAMRVDCQPVISLWLR